MNEVSIDQNSCIDANGNVYSTVKIGTQVWMAENLKSAKNNDGTSIERITDNTAWKDSGTAARCEYNNNTDNSDIYGYLYNRYAVETGKLAPSGWRVPTLDDFKVLERYLGMSIPDSDLWQGGYERGTNEGSKLAGRADLWTDADLESDASFGTSGFNALPAGYREHVWGTFHNINTDAYFWTTTEVSWATIQSHRRQIMHDHIDIHAGSGGLGSGHSVRCVKDDGEISMASQAMSGISITIPPSYASSDRWDTFGIPWNVSKEYWAIT
jgi:uncharacterized protein (TIGR02145 family)